MIDIEEYKEKAKQIFPYIIVFLILAITLFFSVKGQTEYVDPGMCYSETISVGMNETYNSTFEVCSNNITPTTFLNLSLDPGQTLTSSNNTAVEYQVSCTQCSEEASPSLCVIEDERISPGHTFRYESTVCDVTVEARDCPSQDYEQITEKTYEVPYTITYDDILERLFIEVGETQYQWDIGEETQDLNVRRNFEFACPLYVNESSTNAESVLEQCKDVVPVYCTDMTGILLKQIDSFNSKRAEYEDKLEDCRADLSRRVGEQEGYILLSNEEYAEISADNAKLNETSDQAMRRLGGLERENEDLRETKNGFLFVAFLGWAAFIVTKVKYDRVRPGKETGLI